jgi:hypothetical protein
MKLELNATGDTTIAVDQQVLEQTKAAAKSTQQSAALIAATRDEIRRDISSLPALKDDEQLTVTASVSIALKISKKPEAKAEAKPAK